jgi:uncharacterized membrane protein YvbJ
MALIKCSECGKEISDKAASCPNCGNPGTVAPPHMVSIVTSSRKPLKLEPVLISKEWKMEKLYAWCLIVLGFILIGMGMGNSAPDNPVAGIGELILVIGIIALIIGHIGAWYADNRAR